MKRYDRPVDITDEELAALSEEKRTAYITQLLRHSYIWVAYSPSDPNKSDKGLRYSSREDARIHTDHMNSILDTYPVGWNIDHWKTKPEPWIIKELE